MSKKNKGTKGKLFRVAISGKTVDGRNIPANHIVEMAENYDPTHYQGRIWLEHLKSIWPGSDFCAYGDVLSLEAREVTIDGEVVMGLYAELSVNDNLKKINESNQKIFSSIEYHPNFRDKGYAYLTGLAVTDTPASAGTEPLTFSLSKEENSAFTEAIEMSVADDNTQDVVVVDGEESKIVSLFSQFTESLKGIFAKKEDAESTALATTLNELTNLFTQDAAERTEFAAKFTAQETKFAALQKEFSELKAKLSKEPKTHTFTPQIELGNPGSDGLIKPEY